MCDYLRVHKWLFLSYQEFLTLEMLSKQIMCHFWFWHILSNYSSEVCWIYTPTKSMFCICFLTCSPTLDVINLYFKGKAGGKMQHPNFSLSFAFWINGRIFCILLIYICISLSGKFSFTLFTHFPLGLWFVKSLIMEISH